MGDCQTSQEIDVQQKLAETGACLDPAPKSVGSCAVARQGLQPLALVLGGHDVAFLLVERNAHRDPAPEGEILRGLGPAGNCRSGTGVRRPLLQRRCRTAAGKPVLPRLIAADGADPHGTIPENGSANSWISPLTAVARGAALYHLTNLNGVAETMTMPGSPLLTTSPPYRFPPSFARTSPPNLLACPGPPTTTFTISLGWR